jgi:hypothetical protein
MEVQLHLSSALDGGKRSASRRGGFTLREKTYGSHRIGGWADLTAGMAAYEKRKIFFPLLRIKPRYFDPPLKHSWNFSAA